MNDPFDPPTEISGEILSTTSYEHIATEIMASLIPALDKLQRKRIEHMKEAQTELAIISCNLADALIVEINKRQNHE